MSFFWARNMFGAYDYVNGDESRTVADLQPALNRAAARGLANGELSPTGRFYQSLTASLQGSQ